MVLKDANIYNILFESNIIGHIIIDQNEITLIENDELSLIPIAESFGFSGTAYLAKENGFEQVILKPSPELMPLCECKTINLPNLLLTELVT
jgi:hypothetical protein